MGQYYYPLLIEENDSGDKYFRAESHDYGSGLKLMEHSWVGNKFVNAVMGALGEKPMRLAWIGDYAEDVVDTYTIFSDDFCKGKTSFKEYYELANDGRFKDNTAEDIASLDIEPYLFDLDHPDCYLVNLTQGIFIDLERYVKENKYSDGGCVNPLPILTAVGNGQGGGDYCGVNEDDVGCWAFDKLRMTDICPSALHEITVEFRE